MGVRRSEWGEAAQPHAAIPDDVLRPINTIRPSTRRKISYSSSHTAAIMPLVGFCDVDLGAPQPPQRRPKVPCGPHLIAVLMSCA
jgi:hypothetical protein